MAFFTPRQAQAGLLHAVVWGLLGVLLFTQPNHGLTTLSFYLLQSALFAVSLGAFYLNLGWAVPQLLYRRRVLTYLLFLLLVVGSIVIPYQKIRNQLAPQRPPFGVRANDVGPSTTTTSTLPPRRSRGPSGPRRRSEWIDPAVLLSTLLVLGLSTSIAAVQRGQHDAQIRQALEQEKLTTELSWLKAQINPHFFFNTLNNIYALTLMDGDQAREAIHRLSRMMRYVLYETQTGTASLSQELQFVRDYIDLMQLRLTDNVTVEFTTPQPLRDVPIAPMLLLPFVENAFKHGISALEPSRIRIVVQQPLPHVLDITVQNSVFPDQPVALDENSGIGLTNTRRRLELLYPGRHTLTITELTPQHEYRVHLTLDLLS